MSGSRFLSPLGVVIVIFAGLLGYLYLPADSEAARPQGRATPVVVERAQEHVFPITIEALGTAKANESVTITAEQTERVAEVYFDDGDKVEAGQPLIQLNKAEELARIEELQASIAEAKRQLARLTNLAKTNAASEQLVDEQGARVKMLEAQLDVANAQLSELQINAPFAGVLGLREVSVGSLVRPADVITTLDDVSEIKVDFSIAERHLASVGQGQKVFAHSVAYPDQEFAGQITSIDSRIDPVSRSILVRAKIDNQAGLIRPGMLLQITLQKEVLNTLVIDEKALVPVQDKQFVFIVENEKVRQSEVVVGTRKPGRVQILSGIKVGDLVVTEGTLRIRDGSPVRVLNSDTTANVAQPLQAQIEG